MTGSSPNPYVTRDQDSLRKVYAETGSIAVIGASQNAAKAAHRIPRYLQEQGYRIVPVSPRGGEILGEHAYPTLEDVDVPIDVVDVFRPPAEAASIARSAIEFGAKVLWFQPGTHSDEGIYLAAAAGLTVVAYRCMGGTHGRLGLGPGPTKSRKS